MLDGFSFRGCSGMGVGSEFLYAVKQGGMYTPRFSKVHKVDEQVFFPVGIPRCVHLAGKTWPGFSPGQVPRIRVYNGTSDIADVEVFGDFEIWLTNLIPFGAFSYYYVYPKGCPIQVSCEVYDDAIFSSG